MRLIHTHFFLLLQAPYGIILTGEIMTINAMLKQLGYQHITPIQEGVFKSFSSPKHMVGIAPTGTGKTHAYLLPILEKMDVKRFEVQALILVPTNELVVQIQHMLLEITSDFVVKTYYAGTNKMREQEWLEKNQPQIVISTPSQIVDYVIESHLLKIHKAKYVVFDEADMMFDEAFLSMIDHLLPAVKNAKYMLFSATLNNEMDPFIKRYFGQFDLIDTRKAHQLDITYKLIHIKHQERTHALLTLLKLINPYLAFIFVSKKENQDVVYQKMVDESYSVANLNASLGIKKRTKLIDEIRALKYQYVVTSDLAARGLDFKISHVIHYDLPHFLEFYMHRSGRTGRMYDSGEVITLMGIDDHRKIAKLKSQGISFVDYNLTTNSLDPVIKKSKGVSEEEKDAIKKIKKPTRVSPNYKKKNKQAIKKIKQEVRRKQYANQNR